MRKACDTSLTEAGAWDTCAVGTPQTHAVIGKTYDLPKVMRPML